MNILVCVKRVPHTGGRIVLTSDGQDIDTRYLGFTISPHEECALEEAVRIVEAHGGSSAVLTLGPAPAEEQLRVAMAIGIDRAVLLETDGSEWDPVATAGAIVNAIRTHEATNGPFDLLLFGNESADTGGYQVGIRVAVALGRPVVNGVKALSFRDGMAVARREAGGAWETYELPLPAVVGVKEGINLPRYPSVPGRLRAKRKEIERVTLGMPTSPEEANAADGDAAAGLIKLGLRLPTEERTAAEILGRGPEAVPAIVDLLERIGIIYR